MSPLSDKSEAILALLVNGEKLYGLEMINLDPSLKRGTIYVTLSRLEDQKLVSSEEIKPAQGRGPARRVYQITAEGSRLFELASEFKKGVAGLGLGPIYG